MKMQSSLHAGGSRMPAAPVCLPAKPRLVTCHARRPRGSVSGQSATLDPEKSAKEQALERLLSDIGAKHGKGAVMRQGDKPLETIQRFGSGCLSLDLALGGGYPRGRIVEIYGPESCGKTTLALHAIAEVQKLGQTAMLVDVEQALDAQHAQRLGVDMASLLLTQPGCGEDALDIVDMVASNGTVSLIVVDSVSALLPRAELEGDVGQTGVANQARLMSQAMRKLIGSANKGDCTIIFINQIRNKIGVMFGNPETTSGGQALKYYASVRIDLRKKETIKTGDTAIGIKVKAKMIKNKVAAPFREAIFDIIFTRGIDTVGALVDAAESLDVITRKGAWYYMGEKRLGQGRDKAMEAIRQDAALLKEVQDATQAALATNPETPLVLGDLDGDEGELDDIPDALEPLEE